MPQILTKNVKILAAIASNANTPPELLLRLAGEYLSEVSYNPALPLILLENPKFIEELYYKHCNIDRDYKNIKYYSARLSDFFREFTLTHPLVPTLKLLVRYKTKHN